MRIGVLALQGDFDAHVKALAEAGAEAIEIRRAADFEWLDGLVLPGGESTTMLRLLREEALLGPLAEYGRRKPVFGTCAGAILLALEVTHPVQESLGLVDIGVRRNAYGRQVDSRVAVLDPKGGGNGYLFPGVVEAVFIRAPIIERVGAGVRVLLEYKGAPVLVEEGPHLVATFHPELSPERSVHQLFVKKVAEWKGRASLVMAT